MLDRRNITLLVDGRAQRIGTLRRFWKATEIDASRAAEIESVETDRHGKHSPLAVMVPDFEECSLGFAPEQTIAAHLVLGWEVGQIRTNDWNWDYLPVLGYAGEDGRSGEYTLYEKQYGLLYPITFCRAIELDIVTQRGKLIRRPQPSIIYCRYVRPYISTHAAAKCVLDDGNTVDLLTSIESGNLPDPNWYLGKRPRQVHEFSVSSGC